MAKLVSTPSEVVRNIHTLYNYRDGSRSERAFFTGRIKNGKLFVVLRSEGTYLFAPSKFAGYRDNDISHMMDLDNRDGRRTNVAISGLFGRHIDVGDAIYSQIDSAYVAFCKSLSITPSRHHRPRRYWQVVTEESFLLPGEVGEQRPDTEEGALKRVYVNRFERNPAARQACLAKYGYKCQVCTFDFAGTYGSHGRNFIHVHHLVPLSEIGQRYKVDGEADLIPVCPNCHAMLHKGPRTLSLSELRAMLRGPATVAS